MMSMSFFAFESDRRTRAEQRVLCALLRDSGSIRHCEYLKPAHFSHSLHGAIFAAIRQLITKQTPVSGSRVCEILRKTYRQEGFDAFPYLLWIANLSAVPAHSGYYAAIMCEDLHEGHQCSYENGDGMCRECAALAREFHAIGRAYAALARKKGPTQ